MQETVTEVNALNIFYSANYTIYPLIYNSIITNSGAFLEPEDTDETKFHKRFLNSHNKICVIYLFHKSLISFNLLIEYIHRNYTEAWINYCKAVIRALTNQSNKQIDPERLTFEEIFTLQTKFFNQENKKKYKFFFLNKSEFQNRLDIFTEKTLKNVKVIEFDTLHELNLKLLKIPIIFTESFSNLGMVIIDSANTLENFYINISDEKSIVCSIKDKIRNSIDSNGENNPKYNNMNLNDPKILNYKDNKKKPGSASDILTHIYRLLYFYQTSLGFNLMNLIYDYERGSFYNQLNYNRIKYGKNFADFEINNSLNAKFHYLNNSEYIVYKIPNKPMIGIHLLPVESLHTFDEGSGIFAIAHMEGPMKMKVNVFRINKYCKIDHLQEISENIYVKIAKNQKNENEIPGNLNETIDDITINMSQEFNMG